MLDKCKKSNSIYSGNASETESLGHTIGLNCMPGDLILMTGELGAGKTCFTQGLLYGLGSKDHVRSPTFVLIMEYPARIPLYHADLYRISQMNELESIGIEEYLISDGVCVVEWADRIDSIFQIDHLAIKIDWHKSVPASNIRTISLTSKGYRHTKLLDRVISSSSHKII